MPGRGLKRNSKNKKGKIGNYLTEHLRENVSQNERVKFLSRLLFPRCSLTNYFSITSVNSTKV